ncbi:MAG: hypothetical protein WC277_07965 [Bacilli bacterium]
MISITFSHRLVLRTPSARTAEQWIRDLAHDFQVERIEDCGVTLSRSCLLALAVGEQLREFGRSLTDLSISGSA